MYLRGTYVRSQYKHAAGCNGVLHTGHLQGISHSEGAGSLSNRLHEGAFSALRWLEGFLDATTPSWELPPGCLHSTTLHQVDAAWAGY